MSKQVFLTPLTAVETTDLEGVGTLRWEGNKCYKWVKLLNDTATVAGAAGDVALYDAVTGYGLHTVSLDLTDGDSQPLPAGVLGATVTGTVDTAYYCWLQIRGEDTLNAAIETSNDGTPVAAADGDPLCMGDADKALRRMNTTVDADAERIMVCAYAEDASGKTIICDFPF